jgi:hypothetical protein
MWVIRRQWGGGGGMVRDIQNQKRILGLGLLWVAMLLEACQHT